MITDIVQRGKSELYKIYIDDVFCCLLEAEIIVKNKIKKGLDISENELLKLKEQSDYLTCKSQALNYVSKCLKTQKQVYDYLIKKGYLPECVNDAIKALVEYGYINDEYYAKCFIKSKQSGKGKKYFYSALIQKGIDKDIVNEVLSEYQDSSEDIEKIALKYIKNKSQVGIKQKLFRYLLSKGFEYKDVVKVVDRVVKCDEVDGNDWY